VGLESETKEKRRKEKKREEKRRAGKEPTEGQGDDVVYRPQRDCTYDPSNEISCPLINMISHCSSSCDLVISY
jgi:hypothetical protein